MMSRTLFVLFLLCALSSYLPSSNANYVVDTDGDAVRNGGTYFMLPVKTESGGGIEGAATGKENCPLTVVQSLDENSLGLPMTISSPNPSFYISENLNLSIRFFSVMNCGSSPPEWTVVMGLPEGKAVKLTGYRNTVIGSFQIEKGSPDDRSYKLLFCDFEIGECGDVGIFVGDDGNRRLVLAENNHFLFQLQKGTVATARSTSR